MDDKGDKIIYLARELLEAGLPEFQQPKKTIQIAMTFKALCFTTLLAASIGAGATYAVHNEARPLNRYEKTEIKALIFFIGKTKGIDEASLHSAIAEKIGTANLDDMTAAEFPALRRFLQEKAQ